MTASFVGSCHRDCRRCWTIVSVSHANSTPTITARGQVRVVAVVVVLTQDVLRACASPFGAKVRVNVADFAFECLQFLMECLYSFYKTTREH